MPETRIGAEVQPEHRSLADRVEQRAQADAGHEQPA